MKNKQSSTITEVDDVQVSFDVSGAVVVPQKRTFAEEFNAMRGEQRRDQGIARAAANASEDWMAEAKRGIKTIALYKQEFTTDAVHAYLIKFGHHPQHELRAMSAITNWAVKTRICERTDRMVASSRTVANSRKIPVYRSLIFQG